MLDALFNSPLFAIGFIFFVLVLGLIYMANRERAQVKSMKGPRRFRPDWSRTGVRRRKRRWRRDRFRPEWDREPARKPPSRDLRLVEGGKRAEGEDETNSPKTPPRTG
jgi:hypothetical protein